jgi:ribosome biogenesis GTPase
VQGLTWRAYARVVTASAMNLLALGWDEAWQQAASAYAEVGQPGRVSRVDRGLCSVLTADGPVRASFGAAVLETMLADTLAGPCTGDWAIVRHWPDGPETVEALLARRTAVTRAEASGTSRGQLLAVNPDLAAAVIALHPEPNLGRVERLVSLAWESDARPLVVLTKADMVPDADEVAADVASAAPGVKVICTSTVTGQGVQELRDLLEERLTVALLGASGHGKSSLANALVGTDVLTAKRIRADGKGRHTSVRRELLVLPSGGCVIDTPGLRSVGIPGFAGGLSSAFPDIERLAAQCRFDDCQHATEPACAVRAAVEAGTLSIRRLESWNRLQREQRRMAARADVRLRGQLAKDSRHLSKKQRAANRLHP